MKARMRPDLTTRPLFELRVEAMNPTTPGEMGPNGMRVFDSVARGRFDGERLRGEVVAGSGDWRRVRPDGGMDVDARVILKTDDGAVIHMTYSGRIAIPPALLAQARDAERRHLIDPDAYYMRTAPTFETGAARYAWLNDVVAVARGRLTEGGGLAYEVFEVL